MTLIQLVFLAAALMTLAAAISVVTARRLVHAGLWLILCLGGVATFLVLLEAPFLAVVEVLVYIGAISILIIFAVMLTRRVMDDVGPGVTSLWWASAGISLLMLAGLSATFTLVPSLAATTSDLPVDSSVLLSELGRSLVDPNRYVVPFEVASVLLLAAMIGAIFIARPVRVIEGGQDS
jgi:NADH-quinone oxidoreductase subunit J